MLRKEGWRRRRSALGVLAAHCRACTGVRGASRRCNAWALWRLSQEEAANKRRAACRGASPCMAWAACC